MDQASLWDPLHGPWTAASNPKLLWLAVGLAVDPWKWRWRIAALLVLVGITSLGLTAVDFLAVSIGWGSGADKTTSAMFSGMAVVSLVRFKSTPPSSVCVDLWDGERQADRQSQMRTSWDYWSFPTVWSQAEEKMWQPPRSTYVILAETERGWCFFFVKCFICCFLPKLK